MKGRSARRSTYECTLGDRSLRVLTLPVFDLFLQEPIAVAGRRLQIAPVEDGDVPPRVGNQSGLLQRASGNRYA